MEVVPQVAQAPTQPFDLVEPVVSDKQTEHPTYVTPMEAVGNNHAESNNAPESVKASEPEVMPHDPAEENRPADTAVAPSNINGGDSCAVVSEPPVSPHTDRSSEGGAEVVTPAGTVEAPPFETDTPSTEAVEKAAVAPVKKATETKTPAHAVEHEPQNTDHHVGLKVESTLENKVGEKAEEKADQHEAITPAQSIPSVREAEPTPPVASAASLEKKANTEKKQTNNDSFTTEEVLAEVQKFLTLQIVDNRCSSHTKEIHEFMEKHLNEKQQKRYVAPLIERIVQHFTQEASAKGEEVSIDVQSNICLIEQMFLTLGRRSPLEDMYTAEEEEMLDLLFHSNSSDNLPIDI